MRRASHFLRLNFGLFVLAGLGCSSSSTSTNTILRPELVAVSPEDFLGTLTCGKQPGQVQSYVATLFDVTPAEDGSVPDAAVQLPSSPPTSCLSPVTFAHVVTSHRYIAQVDAYDHPSPADAATAPDLTGSVGEAGAGGATSLGNVAAAEGASAISPTAPGSRLVQDPDGVRVTARWTFTCGGYAPARIDGGANTYGGAGSVSEGDTGEAGADNPLVGVLTYDNLTQTVHDCRAGLRMIAR
ncbi:MAG: hypothetical protein ABJB12_20380 [Pseudomonadota bacterium]